MHTCEEENHRNPIPSSLNQDQAKQRYGYANKFDSKSGWNQKKKKEYENERNRIPANAMDNLEKVYVLIRLYLQAIRGEIFWRDTFVYNTRRDPIDCMMGCLDGWAMFKLQEKEEEEDESRPNHQWKSRDGLFRNTQI